MRIIGQSDPNAKPKEWCISTSFKKFPPKIVKKWHVRKELWVSAKQPFFKQTFYDQC